MLPRLLFLEFFKNRFVFSVPVADYFRDDNSCDDCCEMHLFFSFEFILCGAEMLRLHFFTS